MGESGGRDSKKLSHFLFKLVFEAFAGCVC